MGTIILVVIWSAAIYHELCLAWDRCQNRDQTNVYLDTSLMRGQFSFHTFWLPFQIWWIWLYTVSHADSENVHLVNNMLLENDCG